MVCIYEQLYEVFSKMNEVSVAGLFSGCGGLDYGFSQAGYNIVWSNEISNDAAESYHSLLGHKPIVADIWNVIESVPTVDVVIGGPPCQSFSLVGKRIEDDPRGSLVFAYSKVIERVKPKAFVMENVAGLMSSTIDGIRLTEILIKKFSSLGYKVKLEKLMATDFFVPQKRKRVFILGALDDSILSDIPKLQGFARHLEADGFDDIVTVSEALDDLPPVADKGDDSPQAYTKNAHSPYSELMRRNSGLTVKNHSMPTMSEKDKAFVMHIPPGGNYMDIPDEISTQRIMNFKKSGGRTTTYGRLSPDKPAYTINTYFNRPNVGANYHHRENRLITVREAMRLQSFPDHFNPYFTNQRSLHTQIGNAVPPLMARAVAESMKSVFK